MRVRLLRSTGFHSACVALALLTGCRPPESASPQPTAVAPVAVAVAVTNIHRGSITRFISLPGAIRPLQQVTLCAKVGGYLKSIRVDRGDPVKAGVELAEIEAPELLADTVKYRAELEVARREFERLADALKRSPDLVVPLTVDNAKGRFEIAQAVLQRNETLLAYTHIVAPFDGTITRRWADVGALIPTPTASSSAQSAAVLTLMDFSRVRIEVAVPEAESPLLKTALPAEVRVDELGAAPFTGVVTRIAFALDESSRTMPVEIELPNPEGRLRPGMFTTVRIGVSRKEDAALLPLEALVVEKARTSVFVFVDGKARKTAVRVGFEEGGRFEVLEGLLPEDKVILTGKLALGDGQPVQRAGDR